VSSEAARYVLGAPMNPDYSPPLWGGDAYLFGTYVFLETALFVVFGPDVRIALVLNASLAVLGAIFAYSIATSLFGRAAAFATATIIAFYPSLFLWSSLNLKDALTNALAILAIWQLMRLSVTPRISTVLILFVAAELLVGLRAYVAAVVAIAALITVATLTAWTRRRVAVATLTVLVALTTLAQSSNRLAVDVTQLLATFERTRSAMAVGARTAFVPTATPIAVPFSPAPAEPTSNVGTSGREDSSLAVRSTLSHLPLGLAYALFAPVPFLSLRAQELVTAPEMLFWYVLLTAALLTIWQQRRKWRTVAPPILMAGGLTLVLALAEGNTGTLFRHRGMVVPFVVILASPVLVKLFDGLGTFRAAQSARVSTRLSRQRWPTT
jgi:4-amino-4-deoxy-L-arabinose transferase-like glycosyltransferase